MHAAAQQGAPITRLPVQTARTWNVREADHRGTAGGGSSGESTVSGDLRNDALVMGTELHFTESSKARCQRGSYRCELTSRALTRHKEFHVCGDPTVPQLDKIDQLGSHRRASDPRVNIRSPLDRGTRCVDHRPENLMPR